MIFPPASEAMLKYLLHGKHSIVRVNLLLIAEETMLDYSASLGSGTNSVGCSTVGKTPLKAGCDTSLALRVANEAGELR